MVEVARRSVPFGTTGGTTEAAVPSESTVLLAVALVSVALGLTLLVLPIPRALTVVPVALFAIALATLGVVLAASRGRSIGDPSRGHRESSEPPASADVALPAAEKSPPKVAERSVRPASSRGSSWRVLSSSANPGDETWLSWLPRERRRLYAEPGSVAPGVVTSPGKAGNLVAFPVRDYYGGALLPAVRGPRTTLPTPAKERGLIGDEHLPRLTSPHASPFSEEELDRMFPPEGRRRGPVFLPDAPDRIGGGASWAKSAIPTPIASSEAGRLLADVSLSPAPADDLLLDETRPSPLEGLSHKGEGERETEIDLTTDERLSREAANPVPPHLRASGPLLRFEPSRPARGTKSSATPRSVCASCSKVVVNLRMSGPCPKCLRPICNECLREAFVTHGHGWCVDCSSAVAAS